MKMFYEMRFLRATRENVPEVCNVLFIMQIAFKQWYKVGKHNNDIL